MSSGSHQSRDGSRNDAFADAQDAFRRAIEGAYHKGRHSLALELAAFLKNTMNDGFAESVSDSSASKLASRTTKKSKTARKRGSNGIAGVAIKDVFQHRTGLSVKQIYDEAIRLGHTLSVEAIGAELRRHEGEKYRRDDGRSWFPLGSPETETAGNVHHD